MSERSISRKVEDLTKKANDIISKSELFLNKFKSKIYKLKEKNKGIIKGLVKDIEILSKEKEDGLKLLSESSESKEKLKKIVIEEETDLEKFNLENTQLKEQVQKITAEIENRRNYLSKLESDVIVIEQRVSRKEVYRNKKENEYKVKADIFRTVLGFDIMPLKENIIKLVFYNEKYIQNKSMTDLKVDSSIILMDFTKDDVVIDSSFTNLSIQEANKLFKECESFYVFIKKIKNSNY